MRHVKARWDEALSFDDDETTQHTWLTNRTSTTDTSTVATLKRPTQRTSPLLITTHLVRTSNTFNSLHNNGGGYGQGASVNRALTPGGNPVDTTQPAFPGEQADDLICGDPGPHPPSRTVYHRKFANPAPLGLIAFASTTLILSLFNVGARNIETPNVRAL